jgi:NAD(P)-dependent dehydrogenase (short-subunit alcohol dehydrogenase family)
LKENAMTRLLEGKTAFVTGAASGIGAATALAFARHGAKVLVTDIADTSATLDAIAALGGEAYGEALDVTDEAAVDAVVDGMVARWGRIDVGFNNAGISISRMSDEWGKLDTCEKEWAVNQRGVLYCMRAELRHMLRQGSGAIINTASIAGMSGIAGAGYSGSKHAVVGLTRSAALAHASRGIRVNCVMPGVIETPMTSLESQGPAAIEAMAKMHPIGRMGRPEEIADGVVYLASDMASFVTGHALAIDGGFLAA